VSQAVRKKKRKKTNLRQRKSRHKQGNLGDHTAAVLEAPVHNFKKRNLRGTLLHPKAVRRT